MTNSNEQSDESRVTARLKNLIKDLSTYVDNASVDQKRRLLTVLENWQQSDRRKHTRKPCSISITYSTSDRVFTDIIKNICPGGVFIETSEVFSIGQQITLMFASGDLEEPIEVVGKVVWDGPKGIGVKFAAANKDLEKMIKTL